VLVLNEVDKLSKEAQHSLHRTMEKYSASEAVAVLKNLQQQGVTVDSYMCVEVLRQCSKEKDLVATKKVHECIIKSGIEQNIYVANNLLSVYVRCGRLQDARRVFDELGKKDVFSWTIMIGGYAQQYRAKDAYEVFSQMLQECVRPNKITYLNILKACASPSALKWGKEVHAYIRQDGLETDVRVGTALLKMYGKCGSIQEARQVFDKLTNCDGVSWTVMIGAYAENGCGEEAYQLLLQMIHKGFKPNAITFLSILNASASTGASQWVKEVHNHVLELGLEADLRVSSALVHMYAKSGNIDDARRVFNRMQERNVITWTTMIGAYTECGCGIEAYELYLQMKQEGFKPDVLTYLSILKASASNGALDWVKEVHSDAPRSRTCFGFASGQCTCSHVCKEWQYW
jgi:pentatricopeptide repeat protein